MAHLQACMRITERDLERMVLNETAKPMALPLALLEEITNNFSRDFEIGSGGFAVVYKGMLENSDVAVKRLSRTYMYEEEYQREVECLMKAQHNNIVRFLGYCADSQGNAADYNGQFVMADVQQRLLCFEHIPNGSLRDYIKDASGGLEWRICYQIIKDICKGLLYLHQKKIVHLDLKPANILLDRDMKAKITDFGLSRCFKEHQTEFITKKVTGTIGYLPPEFTSGVITHKYDLYSLGVIILEMLTGEKGYQDIKGVLESCSNRFEILQDNPAWEQIIVCAEIGMECTKSDPEDRPDSMEHIIDRLDEIESAELIPNPGAGPMKMLDVDPLELCFPFELNKLIPCSLNLTNNEDAHVAFRLIMDENEQHYDDCFVSVPIYGIVPPRSTYTLVVTAESHHVQHVNTNDLILECAILGDDEHIHMFQSQPDEYFNDDMRMNLQVQVVRLKAVFTLPGEIITSSQPNSPEIKMLSTQRPARSMYSLDTNQDKQWIITGEEHGHVRIWNYQTQKIVDSLKISDAKVTCVKFITRKQWFVAATDNDLIHVYEYWPTKMRRITTFRSSESVHSLVVHPAKPYLLSLHYTEMKLWDWDKGWDCIQTFDKEPSDTILQVVFNQNETIIASASEDHRVKVWSLNSPTSRYTSSEHTDIVNCLDFFTCFGREYLVTASDDKTVKIWDMQKMICVRTLEVLSPVMYVVYHPVLRILITGSKDGCIYLWSPVYSRINFRPPKLLRIVNIGCVDDVVHSLSCLMGSVVIGKENTVVIINIDNHVNNLERTMGNTSEPLSGAYDYKRGPARETSSEVTSAGGGSSSSNLLDVVLDLIRLPCEAESISWSLHLTNKACEHVAFRLTDKRSSSMEAFAKLPLYGIVPSRSSYTLVVSTTKAELARVMKTNFEPILQSSTSGNHYAALFMNQDECRDFFEEAKDMGKVVHEVAVLLKGDYHVPQPREANSEPALIQPRLQITSMNNTGEELCCLDAHPTEPWIISGHANGQVRTWKHGTQGPTHRIQVSEQRVSSMKVVAREKWIVAATSDGFIHVYNCARMTQIKKITSIRENDHCSLKSLAIHPTEQYLLSTSMKLWKWNKGWDCIHNFLVAAHQVAFNPDDANCFASVSGQRVVEVWSLASRRSNYTMSGHLGDVNCLEFFTRGDGQYLITGSDDCTAKIWDLQKRACVHTMEDILSPVMSAIALPGRPYLITGSKHGTVQFWSSSDFRLKRTVNFCGGGPVRSLLCLAGSRRVAIGQKDLVSILEIDVEEMVAIGQNNVVSIMEIDEEEEV